MSWTENKSFSTTGWKLCVTGVIFIAIGTAIFSTNSAPAKLFGSLMSVVGWLMLLASIIVWIMKGVEKSRKPKSS